jgi:hypothetical protein
MYRGEIVALLDSRSAEREDVGLLMATGRRDAPEVVAASVASPASTPDTPPASPDDSAGTDGPVGGAV